MCVKLVIYKDYTEMHGQQKIKTLIIKPRVSVSTPGPPNFLAVTFSGFQDAVSQFNDVLSLK